MDESKRQTGNRMNIRRDPIYVSIEVWRWLRLLAKAEPRPEGHPPSTPDEVADQILRQAIREQHPTINEHQKEIDKLEKALITKLGEERLQNP